MSQPNWDELAAEHRQSIEAFVLAVHAVPEERWEQPLAEGQWTPAQVAEHLRLSYLIAGRELEGGEGLRVRLPWWMRLFVRLRYLGSILSKGRIPGKQRAPREIAPGPGPFERRATLAELGQRVRDLEAALGQRHRRGERGLSHHFFGKLSPSDALRFLTVHNQHHLRQLTGLP
jgi:DinB superfamily